MHRIALPLLALALLATSSGSAHALDGDIVRIFGTFDVGFSGTMTADDAPAGAPDVALGPSVGGTLGFDIGVHDFIAVGLMGSMVSIKSEKDVFSDFTGGVAGMVNVMDPNTGAMIDPTASATGALTDGRLTITDVAIYPRLRIPLPIIEPYVMVPLGYASLSGDGVDSVGGLSLGVTGGVGLKMLPFLALVAEVGYAMYFLDGVDIGETRVNAGLAIGF